MTTSRGLKWSVLGLLAALMTVLVIGLLAGDAGPKPIRVGDADEPGPNEAALAPATSPSSRPEGGPIRPRPLHPVEASFPADGVRVFVVDDCTNQPVAGAQVAWTEDLLAEDDFQWGSSGPDLARDFDQARNHTVADKAGRASVPAFEHMTIAARRGDRFGLREFNDKPEGEVRLMITPSPVIRARVVNSAGAPVGGVPVMFWMTGKTAHGEPLHPGQAVSRDSDGLAILGPWGGVRGSLGTNAQISVSISLPLPSPVKTKWSLDRFRDELPTLTLPETVTVEVVVVDPKGKPVLGHARVFLGRALGDPVPGALPAEGREVDTDSGRALCRTVPLGLPLRVAAFTEAFDAATVDVPAVSLGRNVVELRLERQKGEVGGRLIGPAGTALADADIDVRFHRPSTDASVPTPELRRVHTDADGTFQLIEDRGIFRDGQCELEFATSDGMLSGAIVATACNLDGPTDLGNIPLAFSDLLASGTIVDDEGIPVPGAAVVARVGGAVRGGVVIRLGSRRPTGPFARYRTVSNAKGEFRLPCAAHATMAHEWATSLTLDVTRKGYVQAYPSETLKPGSTRVRVVLQWAGSIEGSIRVSERVPSSGVKIRVTRDASDGSVATTDFTGCVDSDGRFRLAVFPGVVDVSFFVGESAGPIRSVSHVFVQRNDPTRDERLAGVDLRP